MRSNFEKERFRGKLLVWRYERLAMPGMSCGIIWRLALSIARKFLKMKRPEETPNSSSEKLLKHYDLEVGQVEVLLDHVHLTLTAPPRIAPAEAVAILKSVSTKLLLKRYKWLKNLYWGKEAWSGGYFVQSIGLWLYLRKPSRNT